MTIFAWILIAIFALSLIFAPMGIGKERTVGNAIESIALHLALLVFLFLYLFT